MPFTITGTATDGGGGMVVAVEVSDRRRADLAPGHRPGELVLHLDAERVAARPVILSRAVDDSGNLESGRRRHPVDRPDCAAGSEPAWSPPGLQRGQRHHASADSSGTGNGGTISGPTWATGRFGGALSFDGIDDWVTIADANSLDLTNGMTLEAWVRPTALDRLTRRSS